MRLICAASREIYTHCRERFKNKEGRTKDEFLKVYAPLNVNNHQ